MSTLADILRTVAARNMTRNELKVARARLRRMGMTNLSGRAQGPYTVHVGLDVPTDIRAEAGTLIASAAVLAVMGE